VALLVALVMPAVLAARERSRQAQCRDRLRALGTACQHFEGVHRRLPAALWTGAAAVASSAGPGQQFSPHAQLLPFLDQGPLALRIGELPPIVPIWDPDATLPPTTTEISEFVCPSDSHEDGTNYRATTGPWASAFDIDDVKQSGHGAFSDLRGVRFQDVHDGLSHTIAFSERVQSDDDPLTFTKEDYWGSSAAEVLHTRDTNAMTAICGSLSSTPSTYYPFVGHSWLIAGYDHTWYNHSVTPNSQIPDCTANDVPPLALITSASPYPSSTDGVHKAASRHPGGVNVVYLDGHVSFVSDAIDLHLWRALASRDGQEVIGKEGL
jgi:prepilin-type processing-associated H-X9-DG protein